MSGMLFGDSPLICTKADYDYVLARVRQYGAQGRAHTVDVYDGSPPLLVIYNGHHLLTRDSLWADTPWVTVYRHQLADTLEIAAAAPAAPACPLPPPLSPVPPPPACDSAAAPSRRGHAIMPSADFRCFLNLLEPPIEPAPLLQIEVAQVLPDAPAPAQLVPTKRAPRVRPNINRPQVAPYPLRGPRHKAQPTKSLVRDGGFTDNQRPVDAETGLAPTATTTRVVAYREYYNTRLVDVQTGKLPTDSTQQTMPYGLWYNRRPVHHLTGKLVSLETPGAVSYAYYRDHRLVDAVTGAAPHSATSETLPFRLWVKRQAHLKKQNAATAGAPGDAGNQ